MLTITNAATRRGFDVTSGQCNVGRNCTGAVSVSQIKWKQNGTVVQLKSYETGKYVGFISWFRNSLLRNIYY